MIDQRGSKNRGMVTYLRQRFFFTVVMLMLAVAGTMAQPHYKIIDYKKLNDAVTTVKRIVRDNQGMMWFATDDGLYRYDGYDFVNFKSRSGDGVNMPSNRISSMYASSGGGIWCVASERVFLFDTNKSRFIDVLSDYEQKHGESFRIRKVRALPCGTTWIFTEDGKVLALDDDRPSQSVRLLMQHENPDKITVVCDSLQRSWVLTSLYTYLYHQGNMKRFNQPFRRIVVAGHNVWLLTEDGQPFLYDEKRQKMVPWHHHALKSAVVSLSVLSDNTLAVSGDTEMLLVSADGKKVTPTQVTWPIQKVMEDADSRLWILAKDGTLTLTDKNCQQVTNVSGIPAMEKCDIMRDQHGVVWIFTGQGDTYYSMPTNLSHPVQYTDDQLQVSISNTIEDGQGGYWFIHKNHAYRLTFESPHFQHLPLHQSDQVRCVASDSRQHVLVGSRYDLSVAVFSDTGQPIGWLGRDGQIHSSWVRFGAAIYSSCLTDDGTLWLGTKEDGLFRLVPRQSGGFHISQYKMEDGSESTLPDNEIYDLTADRHNRLWIATHKGGLCCITDYRDENPRFLTNADGLPGWKYPNSVSLRALLVTPTDQLLVGAYSGLYVADVSGRELSKISFKEHRREPHRQESLSSSSITDIIRINDGRIFLSTCDGGINELLTKNVLADRLDFRHYNRSTGFPVDIIPAVIEYHHSLWAVAPNQLVELRLKPSQKPDVNSFLMRENPRFSSCRPVRTVDGKCFFGSENGVVLIDLDELSKSSFVPPLVVTGIAKENNLIDYTACWNDSIVLDSNERNLTIWFSALDYENTELVAYAYRIGNSERWTYLGQNHSVTLAQMRPGTYRMHIRSTNSNGVWCDNERVVTIIVKPKFLETPWGVLLILLMICGIVGAIVYTWLYIKRIKRQQHETMEAYLLLLERNERGTTSGEKFDQQVEIPPLPMGSSEEDELMKRVMAFIEDQLDNSDVTIDDMALAVGVSRSGLHRKVKSMLGTSPMEFLREARIRKAAQLLSQTSKTVSEVAYACGFSDPKYFSKCFKAAIGQTPTEYKKEVIQTSSQ